MTDLSERLRFELSRVTTHDPADLRTETLTLVRLAGEIRLTDGPILEMLLRGRDVALRTTKLLSRVTTEKPEVEIHGKIYRITYRSDVAELAKKTRLLDLRGRLLRGMSPELLSGGVSTAAAIWRAAILVDSACRSYTGGKMALAVTAANLELALALKGTARKLGAQASLTQSGERYNIKIVDVDAVAPLLEKVGAPLTAEIFERHRIEYETQQARKSFKTFMEANSSRSEAAATVTIEKLQHALEILGDSLPKHLREAALLRIENPGLSLRDAASLANPPLTKDALAGRIRRVVWAAHKADESIEVVAA